MANSYKIKNITVRQKIATGDDTYIVCGNSDYTVHWDLDNEWAEYAEKTMLVGLDSGEAYSIQFTGTEAALPALPNTRRCVIGLMAGDVRTTTGAMYPCRPSIRDASGVPVEPPADVYAQLVSQLAGKISEPSKDGTAGQALVTDGNGGRSWATVQGGGITPTIGDNGNWYLGDTDTGKPSRGATGVKCDTGPQGPAGKDGAGMDITGAKVGQIAKISDIDSNGAPTAWEPVDMPSAGGETMDLSWKHIRDVELAPDAIEAIVSTTDAGNTFSYDEIMLEFIPNLEGYFYVRASQNANLSKNVSVWVTNSKYSQVHLGLLNKKLAITSAFRTDGSLSFSNNYGGNGDIDKISTIFFGASSSVGAAFTVKIWGR